MGDAEPVFLRAGLAIKTGSEGLASHLHPRSTIPQEIQAPFKSIYRSCPRDGHEESAIALRTYCTINEFAGGRRLKLNAFAAVLVAVRMILVRSHLLGELRHGRGRVRGCAENYRGASSAAPPCNSARRETGADHLLGLSFMIPSLAVGVSSPFASNSGVLLKSSLDSIIASVVTR